MDTKKRPYHKTGHLQSNKRQKKPNSALKECSNDDVLDFDVQELLSRVSLSSDGRRQTLHTPKENESSIVSLLPELQSEVEINISALSSTGDGLALVQPKPGVGHVYVVPFAIPGDRVTAKVYKHDEKRHLSFADFVEVNKPSPMREDTRIQCRYFAKCSGCQFQMMAYQDQLEHKKRIVERAYRNFSSLAPSQVPKVEDTIGSPIAYGYRTKLTPHFDGPPNSRRARRQGGKPDWPGVPAIGFTPKGGRKVLDIEDCPIGTDAVRLGMKLERKRVAEQIDQYRNGATILLRENTHRSPISEATGQSANEAQDVITENRDGILYQKTYITDQNATSTEYVDDFVFQNPAGAFFQNNNSILPKFTQHIRERILTVDDASRPKLTNLIDAYCGSGLFTITMASLFKQSKGIDISGPSIKFAKRNAELNNLPEKQAEFIAADASDLFASVNFPSQETVVVIDPPRKGCDENFLRQLVNFSPAKVVYVSCNVHTQARDVGLLVGGNGDGVQGTYEIESLCGFDFFPQTGHVESVAILRKAAGASA